MKLLSELENVLKKAGKNRGKNITTLIVYIVIGIMLILAADVFLSEKPRSGGQPQKLDQANLENEGFFVMSYTEALEKQLKGMLSKIQGVGEVDVMITLSAEKQVVPAFNKNENQKTTEEKDNGGGERVITEKNENIEVVVLNENGRDQPLIIQEIMPRINGVMVVAEWAENPVVCANITLAVETALNLPAYKIRVLPRKK